MKKEEGADSEGEETRGVGGEGTKEAHKALDIERPKRIHARGTSRGVLRDYPKSERSDRDKPSLGNRPGRKNNLACTPSSLSPAQSPLVPTLGSVDTIAVKAASSANSVNAEDSLHLRKNNLLRTPNSLSPTESPTQSLVPTLGSVETVAANSVNAGYSVANSTSSVVLTTEATARISVASSNSVGSGTLTS
eukprot:TRINITY_DN3324_c0_g1_i4.p1 TRINITY_DN3324_c0_g1~~TRINITY_DN3324_c0_g1_i4.p1  ORF type:complete len:192 (+),score=50.54 TRINITY_DN3324_c0_g1_i4:224-799(+)